MRTCLGKEERGYCGGSLRARAAALHALSVRVGFLIDRWEERRGGAERALFALARYLVKRGHDVRAFALEEPARADESAGSFRRVRTFGLTRGAREERLARRLEAAAREDGCERTIGVRHLHAVDLLWPHGGSHRATLEALSQRVRGRHRTFVALERELLDDGGARAVACPSTLVRDELAALYPRARPRLHLAPNGVDLERFHPRARDSASRGLRVRVGIDSRMPLLVFAASNPSLKGLPQLAMALRTLRALPWFLIVAGPRDAARWRRLLERTGIDAGRSRVFAHLDSVEIAAGADVCVLPTWRDACGMVVLEALAAGTPVVTTKRAGAAEVVRSPEHGEVIDEPRPDLLRGALERSIERVRAGNLSRDSIREAVAGRDVPSWLARLEQLLVEIPRLER